jgi:hypothetical protein
MRKRNTMNMPIFDATAAAIVNMMNNRLQIWYNGNRPYISDNGAMTIEVSHLSVLSNCEE